MDGDQTVGGAGSNVAAVLGFDPDALRDKYRPSATSACAPTATTQYVEVDGRVRPLRRRPLRRARLHPRAAAPTRSTSRSSAAASAAC